MFHFRCAACHLTSRATRHPSEDQPRDVDGVSGPGMHDGDGMGVWGLAPSRGAGRSPAKKILASFGGLEAISVRKRHYQFGKPRPPNWAIFLLNILLLTQNQKSVQPLFKSHQLLLQWWDYYGQPTSYFLWRVCPPYRPKCPKMGVRTRVRTHFFRYVAGSYA